MPSDVPSASKATEEVEWQYVAQSLGQVAQWLQDSVPDPFQVEPGFPRDLHDSYYDTPGWRLYRAGVICRVRRKGDDAELTLKTMAGPIDDIRTRSELSEALPPDGASDPLEAPGAVGGAIRATVGGEQLRCLFQLHTRRQVYALADAEAPLGEIALDSTSVDHGERPPLLRVEVETTDIERARPFVEALVSANRLQGATLSKFQAGLAAAGLEAPERPSFGPTELPGEMPVRDYALAVLRRHFATLVANEPGTRLGMDAEYLHDMRVASRRIRAAVSTFQSVLPPDILDLREDLRRLTRSLGPVRDLDVQLERLAAWRRELPGVEPADLDPLEDLLREHRAEERSHMLAALDSARYRQLETDLRTALQSERESPEGKGARPAATVIPALVRRRYRQVKRDGKRIGPASDATAYHQLRIRAKKLRYTAEFATPIGGRPARAFVRRVKALQDILGLHQDAEVARESLRQLALDHPGRLPPATLLAIGVVLERYRAQEMELRQQFPRAFQRVRGKAWRQLRKRLEKRARAARKH